MKAKKENKKRIFIGSFTKTNKLYSEYNVIKNIFNKSGKISWTKTPHNFHITYQFLGNIEINNAEKINDFLKNTFSEQIPIEIEIKGLGYFLRKGNPSVLFAKVIEQKGTLKHLYKKINNFLINEGIVEETVSNKPFYPHITLGRIKKTNYMFFEQIEKYKNYNFGTISYIKINVIESILLPDGALYKIFHNNDI